MANEVLIERAKAFMQAVAAQAPWAEIEQYYASDVSQEEFPNRLLPKGTVRNLEALRDASAKGRKVIKADHRDRERLLVGLMRVLEAIWTGHARSRLRHAETRRPIARIAQVFEFKDGFIWRQRNYDCLEAR